MSPRREMYLDNHRHVRQQEYSRGGAKKRGGGFYQCGYDKRIYPSGQSVDDGDDVEYDDSMGYDYQDGWDGSREPDGYSHHMRGGYDDTGDFKEWHGVRETYGYSSDMRGGYGDTCNFRERSQHLSEDGIWEMHSCYDFLHNDSSTSCRMHHPRGRAIVQSPQRNTKYFSYRREARFSAYKQWTEPSELSRNKVGFQDKKSKEIQMCQSTSTKKVFKWDKNGKQGTLNNTPKVEEQLNAIQKLELELKQMRARLNEKTDDMDFMESFSQTLAIKGRQSNDELQDIRQELISLSSAYKHPGT
uniref:Uncharacterized protein n=1 Tax=Leersia perrieri TaxID=77586 RepID=A0A0D9W369_9ORYZ